MRNNNNSSSFLAFVSESLAVEQDSRGLKVTFTALKENDHHGNRDKETILSGCALLEDTESPQLLRTTGPGN